MMPAKSATAWSAAFLFLTTAISRSATSSKRSPPSASRQKLSPKVVGRLSFVISCFCPRLTTNDERPHDRVSHPRIEHRARAILERQAASDAQFERPAAQQLQCLGGGIRF